NVFCLLRIITIEMLPLAWPMSGRSISVIVCRLISGSLCLTLPHLTVESYEADPDNNYWTELAKLVKEKLDPNLKVWVEYSNETWSSGESFRQGDYAAQR